MYLKKLLENILEETPSIKKNKKKENPAATVSCELNPLRVACLNL